MSDRVHEIQQALQIIKKIREEKKMTQKAIADAMGISESFYCQLEGGKRRLTMDHAMKIANILSKSLDEIFLPTNLANCQYDDNPEENENKE